ncbi:hypothetical protein B0T22DRAFT_494003 [Podospora appendiculata]|uniref:Heterokaryon incompatibility domain-containing protein n=1 Tax=Podospora appendiculata TaxID=314037 RepID=A0AAE0X0K9_9PEZI|nr:hypothetical protein B0T22DRAFT_494003 [Podospora appendiculata]
MTEQLEPLYRPVRSEDHEIRLVILHPSPDLDSPLICDLSHTFLPDKAISYEALSYVDALYVDQTNIPERSSQVQLMRTIFRNCTTDLFWLGPDTNHRGRVAGHLRRWARDARLGCRLGVPDAQLRALGPASAFHGPSSSISARSGRDSLYGLLGLVSEAHGIVVDYALTTQEVFTDAATRLVDLEGNLDVLSQSPWQMHGNKLRMAGLPSWLPDFAAAGSPELLFAQRRIFHAGGGGFRVPCEVVGKGMKALCLEGIWLGDVQTVPSPNTDVDAFVERARVDVISADDVDNASVYPATGEPRVQAYSRTVCADCKGYPIQGLTASDVKTYTASLRKAIRDDGVDIPAPAKLPDALDNRVTLDRICNWRFAVTDSGLFALVPKSTEEADRIVVVPGSKTPLVVRRADTSVDGLGGEVVPGY